MGCTCIYLETDTFHFQIVCLIFLLSYFIQNKIKVIIPMTLRENAKSVCCWVFLRNIEYALRTSTQIFPAR